VRYNKKGDIGVTVRWNKWSDPQQRTLCCPLAPKHCKYPCKGLSCDAQCTLSCGLFSLFKCPPVSCAKANPFQCIPSSSNTCPAGWTVSGSKCFRLFTDNTDWLTALRRCMAQGGTLAKIESDAENMVVQGLTSGLTNAQPPFIGLQDFTQEGTFSWGNGMALGSYTNWLQGNNPQPDNGANGDATAMGNQHCVAMRPSDGTWNDLVCTGPRAYVCQRPG